MKCLIEGCERKVRSRGLCSCCYTAAKNAVKVGKTTWEELERRGLSLPSTGVGGHVGAFTKALAASRDGDTAAAAPPAPTTIPGSNEPRPDDPGDTIYIGVPEANLEAPPSERDRMRAGEAVALVRRSEPEPPTELPPSHPNYVGSRVSPPAPWQK
jgi:hypothetical protein